MYLRASAVAIIAQTFKPQMNTDKDLRKERTRIYTNVNEFDVFELFVSICAYLCSFVFRRDFFGLLIYICVYLRASVVTLAGSFLNRG